jgi:hypothetical protein
MLNKLVQYSAHYGKILMASYIVLTITAVMFLFQGNKQEAGLLLFLSGVAGFGPRLIIHGLSSALGMLLLLSGLMVTNMFNPGVGLGFFAAGAALMLGIVNVKGDSK